MTATTPPRALSPASAAEIARILHHANGQALRPPVPSASLGWQRSWALPATIGMAAAPLAGAAAAVLTGNLGIGLLCASLAAGIAATGAWLLAYSGPGPDADMHAAEPEWTQSKIFDSLYDS